MYNEWNMWMKAVQRNEQIQIVYYTLCKKMFQQIAFQNNNEMLKLLHAQLIWSCDHDLINLILHVNQVYSILISKILLMRNVYYMKYS